jgi:NAD(P)-dependent dehydrogenase (short-subunit alcohol dehydrogenase family)
VPHVLASERGGSIVLMSSMAALTGNANTANYTASKHGVAGLMRVLVAEPGPHRIRVNTVNPTGVATPMVLNEANYRLSRPDLEAPAEADLRAASGQMHKLPIGLIEPDDVSTRSCICYPIRPATSPAWLSLSMPDWRSDVGGEPLARPVGEVRRQA